MRTDCKSLCALVQINPSWISMDALPGGTHCTSSSKVKAPFHSLKDYNLDLHQNSKF